MRRSCNLLTAVPLSVPLGVVGREGDTESTEVGWVVTPLLNLEWGTEMDLVGEGLHEHPPPQGRWLATLRGHTWGQRHSQMRRQLKPRYPENALSSPAPRAETRRQATPPGWDTRVPVVSGEKGAADRGHSPAALQHSYSPHPLVSRLQFLF